MLTGSSVPLYFAMGLAICLVVREFRWRIRKKTWIPSEGEVVGYSQKSSEDGSCPVIRFHFKGEEREQICEFNLNNYRLGTTVPILINPVSGEVFVTTYQDRWFLSVFLFVSVVLLCLFSYASHRSSGL